MNPKAALYSQKLFSKPTKIDTVNESMPYQKDNSVLIDAHNAWNSLDLFRKQAKRNKEYIFGDQWSDRINVGGKWITERQHIINQGNVPMQNNRIRGTIRTVVSLFSANSTEPVCTVRDTEEQGMGDTMSAAIQYVYQINEMESLDPLQLMYLLGSGAVAYKSEWGTVGESGTQDVRISEVNYNDIFFDTNMTDPRHWDCSMVGQLHELGLKDVMGLFAKTKEEAEYIKNVYRYVDYDRIVQNLDTITEDRKYNQSFFIPKDNTLCRVIEVWRKEAKERIRVIDRLTGDLYKVEVEEEVNLVNENKARVIQQTEMGVLPENFKLLELEWFVDVYWHFWFMSPSGDVLMKGETPYSHKSHPFAFIITPFYDGQVYPFVNDFIDQQRILNRYIITQDFITRHAAKGALMIHEDAIPTNMTIEDVASEYTKVGGVFLFKGKPGTPIPQTIVSNVTNAGMYEMINLQLKMFEDISGVQGALQGQAPNSGTPASLFAQQVQNSATSLTEVFNSFRSVRKRLAIKTMKNIQQFYDTPKYINLVGQDGRNVFYDPKKIQNAEIDLALTESPSTPSYRMVINDMLMNLMNQGAITLDEMLQVGSFPYKDKLLNLIKQRQAAGQPINAEQVMQEAQQ
jgi:hypothetical protein